MFRLHVDLASLYNLVVAGACCRLIIEVDLSEHVDNRVRQNLDQALSEEVGLTVEEAKQVADVTIYSSWRLFRKLLQENCDVLNAYRLVRAVRVEDLSGQIPDNIVGDLGSLPLYDQADELSQV